MCSEGLFDLPDAFWDKWVDVLYSRCAATCLRKSTEATLAIYDDIVDDHLCCQERPAPDDLLRTILVNIHVGGICADLLKLDWEVWITHLNVKSVIV